MIDRRRLDGLLFAALGDKTLVERWWARPNRAFGQARPIDVFEQDPYRVRDYIFSACGLTGEYS